MAKYDVYRRTEQDGYLLDVQTDLLDELKTRVVVPLIAAGIRRHSQLRRLNPVFHDRRKQLRDGHAI